MTTGCKSFDQTPELRDPIYLDLQSQLEDAKRKKEDILSGIELTEGKLQESVGDPKKYRKNRQDLLDEKKDLLMAEQEVRFLEIRTRSRLIEARDQYLEAFKKGQAWPNPQVFEHYEQNKALRSAPRTWGRGARTTSF